MNTGGEAQPAEHGWLAPSPRLLRMRVSEILATAAAGVVAAVAGLASAGNTALGGVLGGVIVVLAIVGLWIAVRRYRAWGYCERSRDLLVRRGVLVRRLTVVPYGRMQLVDVTAGAVERIFGLATIKLHTAAAATDARIPGLVPAEATRLRDQLAAFGEAQAAGI